MLNPTTDAPIQLTGHLLIREDREGVWVAVRNSEDKVPSWMLADVAATDTNYRICVFPNEHSAAEALSSMIRQYGYRTVSRSYLRVEAIPGTRTPVEVEWTGYEAATQPQGD
jgi:hypothetical protein